VLHFSPLEKFDNQVFTIVFPFLEEERFVFGGFKSPPKEEEGTHKFPYFS
jgi:hypothetical protein